MSNCASIILSSNQASSSKRRRRTEDLDSGGSSGRAGCTFNGCRRRSGSSETFCSKTHRDFFMAELFDVVKNGGAQLTEELSGTCKLSGCDLPVWGRYDFCASEHAVKHREQWGLDDRLCKFDSCTRHVHVGEKSLKISEYCSREHQISASGLRGKQRAPERIDGGKGLGGGAEIQEMSSSQDAPQKPLQATIEKQRGYHYERVDEAMEHCLRHLLMNPGNFNNADPSGYFCIVESIQDFHPFDEVREFGGFMPKWFVHWIDSKSGTRRRTKQEFGWKQTSDGHENKSTCHHLNTTYFHYELKVKKNDSKDDHSDGYMEAYRQFEEARYNGKLERGTKKRWRMYQFSLSPNIAKEVTGGKIPTKIPVISKIFQNKTGLPVWPPLPQKNASVSVESEFAMSTKVHGLKESLAISPLMEVTADEGNAALTVGTIPAVGFQEDGVITSGSPSNTSLSEGLPPLDCDDSSPSTTSLGDGWSPMSLDNFLDDMFDQSKAGGGDILSWFGW